MLGLCMNMNMKLYVTYNLFMLDIEVIFIIHIGWKKYKNLR